MVKSWCWLIKVCHAWCMDVVLTEIIWLKRLRLKWRRGFGPGCFQIHKTLRHCREQIPVTCSHRSSIWNSIENCILIEDDNCQMYNKDHSIVWFTMSTIYLGLDRFFANTACVCVLPWHRGKTVFGFSPHHPKDACKLRGLLSTSELGRARTSCYRCPLPSLPPSLPRQPVQCLPTMLWERDQKT